MKTPQLEKLKPSFFSFWVTNYKVSFLFLFLIILAGISAIITIPKESTPDIKFGIISIVTTYPGVNPSDMDSLITEKIEDKISDIDGIDKITSTSSVGVSSVVVQLKNEANTRDVLADIKDKVDGITFPEDANDPSIQELSMQNDLMFDMLLYGDDAQYDSFTLMQLAEKMKNDLEGENGISSMDIGGTSSDVYASKTDSEEYEIQVHILKSRLESLGISLYSVANKIASFNKNTPIGNYAIGDLNYDFRFDGELADITELKNVIIRVSGGSIVRLGDIANITLEYPNIHDQILGDFTIQGQNFIALAVNKKTGESIFSASKSAKNAIESYINSHSEFQNLHVKYINDLGEEIILDYKNLSSTALQTFVLVFITILFFVGFRESLIASILLPLSFFITFIVLELLGLSLNFLTNFSLVLTLGIAIDTIIVIIEGASEKQRLGFHRKNAIILAMQDLKAPLISGTVTTLAAFLPMIFLPGVVGKFLAYIPITVFSTLVASLILSLTLAGALFFKLAAKKTDFIRDNLYEKTLSQEEEIFLNHERNGKKELFAGHNKREQILEKLSEQYYKVLNSFIHKPIRRFVAIFSPFILLIFTFIFLSPQIGFTLFPSTDEGIINITIEGKTGSDESVMTPYIPEIEKVISNFEELKVYTIKVSGNSLTIYVQLSDVNERKKLKQKSVFQVEEEILEGLNPLSSKGLKVSVATESNGPPTGSAVGIKIQSNSAEDIDTIKKVAKDFEAYVKTIPGTKNVGLSSTDNPGQFVFTFDNQKLAYAGLTPSDILAELRIYFAGLTAGSITSKYEDNDIILSLEDYSEKVSPSDIENTIIQTAVGPVRVGDYATYSFEESLSSITRLDGKVNISVESEVDSGFLPSEIQPQLDAFAQSYNFPEGISYSSGGENAENSDLIYSTVQSFFIAIFLIFMILVFQFNSYGQPAMILYSVVLGMLGVNIGLFLTGNPYSMTFGIGFIALTGVVVNDAIIMIDRINRNIDRLTKNSDVSKLQFEDYVQALVSAGKSRLQPIIVTTITTVFGVLPLAMQDEFWAGLGYTLIFGLTAGSAMTLFIIPAIYYSTYLKKKIRLAQEKYAIEE